MPAHSPHRHRPASRWCFRGRGRTRVRCACVAWLALGLVDANPEPRQPRADVGAYGRRVLPNTPRDDEAIEATKDTGQCADLPGDVERKILEGESCARLRAGEQIAHVAAHAG